MPAIFVASRAMQKQIIDNMNFQPRQLRRAFRADSAQSGDGQREWVGNMRHAGSLYGKPESEK
jgi:hypothetical protein